jgi:hypothetical protein
MTRQAIKQLGVTYELGTEHENLYFRGIAQSVEDVEVFNECNLEGSIALKALSANSVNNEGILQAHSLTVEKLSSQGTVTLGGNLQTTKLDLHGTLAAASITAKNIFGIGIINVQDKIATKTFDFIGSITAAIITSKKFSLCGAVTGKQLTADTVDILLRNDNPSTIDSVIATSVSVRSKHPSALLECKDIEAKEITLENVTAQRVIGDIIKISSGCQIDEVHYTMSLTVDKTSSVNKTVEH